MKNKKRISPGERSDLKSKKKYYGQFGFGTWKICINEWFSYTYESPSWLLEEVHNHNRTIAIR